MSVARQVVSSVARQVARSVVRSARGGGYDYLVDSLVAINNLPTLSPGNRVGISRGLDEVGCLSFGSVENLTIEATGVGNPPRLTAFSEITDWTQNATYSVVYEHNLDISGAVNNTSRIALRVDGAFLTRASSLANCASTPGTYFNDNTSIGSDADDLRMVYYHPAGSTNPNADGKLVEILTKEDCLRSLGGSVTVTELEVDGALSNNGPLYVGQNKSTTGAMPKPQTIKQLLARNGGKHNMLIGSGLLQDSVLHLHDNTTAVEPTNGILGVYEPEASNLSLEVRNTHIVATTSTTSRRAGWSQPITMHASDSSRYASFHWYGGSVKGTSQSEFGGADTALVDGVFVDRVGVMLIPPNMGSSGNPSVTRRLLGRMDLATAGQQTRVNLFRPLMEFYDCCWYTTAFSDNTAMYELQISCDILLQNCVFCSGDTNARLMMVAGGQTGNTHTCELNGCVIWTRNQEQFSNLDTLSGSRNICIRRESLMGYSLDADTNLIITTGNVGSYLTVLGLTSTGNAATDIVNFVNALFLNGLTGVSNGDFRLSANAANLQFGDGEYVGDHNVGAQTHWDHNKGASVSGPPTRWPVCPISLADAREFIADPAAWNFYP